MPGHEVVDVPAADAARCERGPRVGRERSSVAIARAVTKVVTNEVSRLNIAFSRVDTSR